MEERRRRTDRGAMCWLAMRAGELWDFIDKRDIDKHVVSMAVLAGTVMITKWAMSFAELAARLQVTQVGGPEGMVPPVSGFEAAAVIAAVLAPYMALQAAALKYYFESRSE